MLGHGEILEHSQYAREPRNAEAAAGHLVELSSSRIRLNCALEFPTLHWGVEEANHQNHILSEWSDGANFGVWWPPQTTETLRAFAMAVREDRTLRAIVSICAIVMLGTPERSFASAFLNPNESAGAASVSTAG